MSFLASAMQTDHRPVLDDETYQELCRYLADQGQLIPGGVSAREMWKKCWDGSKNWTHTCPLSMKRTAWHRLSLQ